MVGQSLSNDEKTWEPVKFLILSMGANKAVILKYRYLTGGRWPIEGMAVTR